MAGNLRPRTAWVPMGSQVAITSAMQMVLPKASHNHWDVVLAGPSPSQAAAIPFHYTF